MSFANEVKDFVSVFKSTYDAGSKIESKHAKGKDARDLKAAQDKAEADASASLRQGVPVGQASTSDAGTSGADAASQQANIGNLGERAQYIRAGLIDRGLPEHIADGFVMNMQDESGFNPGINEAKPTIPGSRGGFGLYQVTGPRRVAYEQYAKERGTSLSNIDTQLDFMVHELQGPEKAAYDQILKTKTAGEAGAAIVNSFLRPRKDHRIARANKYMNTPGSVPVQQASAPAPTSALPVDDGEQTPDDRRAAADDADDYTNRQRAAAGLPPLPRSAIPGGSYGGVNTVALADGGAVPSGATADTGVAAGWQSQAPDRRGSVFLDQFQYTPSERPSARAPTEPTRSYRYEDYMTGAGDKFAAQRQDRMQQFEQSRATAAAEAAERQRVRDVAARRDQLMKMGVPPWMIDADGNMVQGGPQGVSQFQPVDFNSGAAMSPTQDQQQGLWAFADGGAVPDKAPEDEGPVPFFATQPQAVREQQGQPAPMPQQREQYDTSAVAREGVDRLPEVVAAGMQGITENYQLANQQDPAARQQGLQRFARNEGAARPSEIREVDSAIDPNGQLGAGARQIARLYAGYKFYLDKGDAAKAKNYAASMLMYSKSVLSAAGPVLQVQAERGDTKGAARTVEQAYGALPTGQSIEATPVGNKGVRIQMFDADGNLTQKGEVTLNQLTQLATGMGDGTLWYRAMGLMSQPKKSGMTEAEARRDRRAEESAGRAKERHDIYMEGQRRRLAQPRAAGSARTTADERKAQAIDADAAAALDLGPVQNSAVPTQPVDEQTAPIRTPNAPAALPSMAQNDQSMAGNTPARTAPTMQMPAGTQGEAGPEARAATEMEGAPETAAAFNRERGVRAAQNMATVADAAYKKQQLKPGRTRAAPTTLDKSLDSAFGTILPEDREINPQAKARMKSIAASIVNGNPNVSPEDAAQITARMFDKNNRTIGLERDGRVRIGSGDPVYLDRRSIELVQALRGNSMVVQEQPKGDRRVARNASSAPRTAASRANAKKSIDAYRRDREAERTGVDLRRRNYVPGAQSGVSVSRNTAAGRDEDT